MNGLRITALLALLGVGLLPARAQEGVANPKKNPYADPSVDRDKYSDSEAKVNEARLYNFYQRQADYYMAMPADERPALVPAHPGLDAGLHGHWGKHNQNQHKDGRWNDVKIGSMHTHVTRGGKALPLVIKGINVKLGDGLAVCFDPDSLNYRAVWKGWISFNPFRWGSSRNATITGNTQFTQQEPVALEDGQYLGVYRNGDRVIFHYRVGEVELLDSPGD